MSGGLQLPSVVEYMSGYLCSVPGDRSSLCRDSAHTSVSYIPDRRQMRSRPYRGAGTGAFCEDIVGIVVGTSSRHAQNHVKSIVSIVLSDKL